MLKEKIILVDGNSLFFKAFYASFYSHGGHKHDKETYKDESNNGVRAFINMINILRQKTNNIVVAFDHRNTKTFRHEHDFYKAGRSKAPIDLYRQIDIAKQFLDVYGVLQLEDDRYEADDIIGIIAKKIQSTYDVDIVTGDKDLLQLVDKSINVLISKTGVTVVDKFTIDNFADKMFGLLPNQVVDLKGIMGDSSDNLKGIHGIGEKGGVKLLLKYGSFDNLMEAYADNETSSIINKIIASKDIAFLSRDMATIITTGELDIDYESDFKSAPSDIEELENFLTENNLFSLKGKLW